MPYKIIYHVGKEVTTKTKVDSGILSFQDGVACISGPSTLTIPLSEITDAELFRLPRLGHMIKLIGRDRTIFLTVVRFNFLGYFAIVNYLKTVELHDLIKRGIPNAGTSPINGPTQITIRRSDGMMDAARAYKIKLDGKGVGSVRASNSTTIPIPPGKHSLVLRIDWLGSPQIEFEAKLGEHLCFECGNQLGILGAVLASHGGAHGGHYLWLRRITETSQA